MASKGTRSIWELANVEHEHYASRLRQIAKQIRVLIAGFDIDAVIDGDDALIRTLIQYSLTIQPWAKSVGDLMVATANHRNERRWKQNGKSMAAALRNEVMNAPTGAILLARREKQVELISSIPRKAGERVQKVVLEAQYSGRRAADIAKEIMATSNVSEAKANLIARTEVSTTANELTIARALYVGSEGYTWRSSRDGNVRPTHVEVNGRYFRYDAPPKTDAGLAPYHAGCGPNCRCYVDPVF